MATRSRCCSVHTAACAECQLVATTVAYYSQNVRHEPVDGENTAYLELEAVFGAYPGVAEFQLMHGSYNRPAMFHTD